MLQSIYPQQSKSEHNFPDQHISSTSSVSISREPAWCFPVRLFLLSGSLSPRNWCNTFVYYWSFLHRRKRWPKFVFPVPGSLLCLRHLRTSFRISGIKHISSISHRLSADWKTICKVELSVKSLNGCDYDFRLINLDESDPKWVGAWWVVLYCSAEITLFRWVGFQVVSVLALFAVLPILSLPKVLPESLKWHRKRLRDETLAGSKKKRTPECCGVAYKTAAVSGSRLMQLDGKPLNFPWPLTCLSSDQTVSNAVYESMPAVKQNSGPIWYSLWLDVRHIPIAIYRILSNGPYMLITLGMAVDGKAVFIQTITIYVFSFVHMLWWCR